MAPALVKYVAVPINGWTTKSQSSSRSSSCQMRSDWHFFGASQAMLLRSACCSLVRNDSPVLTPRWPSRYYEQLDLSSQKNPSKEWQGSSKPKNPVGFISLSVILFLDIRHNQVWNTLKWSDSTWQYNRVHLSILSCTCTDSPEKPAESKISCFLCSNFALCPGFIFLTGDIYNKAHIFAIFSKHMNILLDIQKRTLFVDVCFATQKWCAPGTNIYIYIDR